MEDRGREGVFQVTIKQLKGLGMSIPKLWTVYLVHSAVVLLCEITSTSNSCKISGPRRVMLNKIVNINHSHYQIRNSCSINLYDYAYQLWEETDHINFAAVTLNSRMDPSSRTRARLTTVLYLRGLCSDRS